jgi:MFS family permease
VPIVSSADRWPNRVYRVPLGRDALQARVLQEATRLRDEFPTRSFVFRTSALMLVPYSDGFDLIHFPINSQPFGWLSVKVEATGSGCRLHVSRRRRPRPERAIFVIFPVFILLGTLASALAPNGAPIFFPFVMLIPIAIVLGIMVYRERSQERRLLNLLADVFPGLLEESELAGPVAQPLV